MARSFCPDCKSEFGYDELLGLNVRYFEAEFNAVGFRAGGLSPICPQCLKRCDTEAAIQWKASQMRVQWKAMPLKKGDNQ